MGKSSIMDEQKKWLESHIPAFAEVQKKSTVARFHSHIAEGWFEKYPERNALFPTAAGEPSAVLTPPQEDELCDAIKARKKQLRNWFNWNARGYKRSSDSSVFSNMLMQSLVKNKRSRNLNAAEIYGKLYVEKVREAVSAAKADQSGGKLSQGEHLILFKSVRATLFSAESEEVKAEVAAECLKQKGGQDSEDGKEVDGMDDGCEVEKNPEEFQKAIDELPDVLDKIFNCLCASTGWAFFIGCAGPLPKAGGTVYQHDYYFGPKSDGGRDFHEAYTGFKKGFALPFSQFVRNAFPPEVCQERAFSFAGAGRPILDNDIAETQPILDSDVAKTLIAMPRSESPSIEMMPSIGPDLCESSGPSSEPDLSLLPTSSALPLNTPPVLDSSSLATPAHSPRKQALDRYRSGQTLEAPGDDISLSTGSAWNDNQDGGLDAAFGGTVLTDSIEGSEKRFPMSGGSSVEVNGLPLAPGAPSSPISHAFARMDQSLFAQRQTPPPPASSPSPLRDPFIDPLLYMENMGKPASTAGILLASAPGFVFQRTPPRREPLAVTTQEKSDLNNPFATLTSDPRVFGRAPINPFTLGRTVNPSSASPPKTPLPSAPASALTPTPPPSSPPSSAPLNSEASTTVNYTIHGAAINADLASSDSATQEHRQIRPRPRPCPIKKPGVNATLLSSGGDACNGDTESAPGTTTHTPISTGANTAPSSSTDATPSNNTTPAPPLGDGPSDKENHAPLTELTRYEKAALTRARKKREAEEALGALDKGANGKGDSEKGSKGSGKKRKEPEGSRKSRSGHEVRKPNYWVPEG
ncbi:uncharacterized protein LACBIDRAFT_304581 [Laccaria bicolor S238N-H82]|uniref:Predicted protein n=1 Tax=Laccaria bicolor (strain S238N-H82 / ATCC MYA-4686) TaxID=486041 RepID=B0DLY2_LACBS|nr:uncharacterized protein LACBIDRAFT_304581 [Laccaria bicolor S238N-H82]EDR04474.1 predicted protein [Laccaria bicolor S238N-H82]|eukprot:XP_001884993.1 predicted protein [Laccaria bicolor S238N-H82]